MHPADDDALITDEKIWDLTQNINVKGGEYCRVRIQTKLIRSTALIVWFGCKHAILAMRNVSCSRNACSSY